MTDRPILFSAPMVLAILDGRKTQTRRVINPQPVITENGCFNWDAKLKAFRGMAGTHFDDSAKEMMAFHCPLGRPKDKLWVRESCQADHNTSDAVTLAKYSADGSNVLYSGPEKNEEGDADYGGSCAHWWYSKESCPSIHMPRWASRITLEITNVRVERLQDISEADAIAEGMIKGSYGFYNGTTGCEADTKETTFCAAKNCFGNLWQSINGPESWSANPFVWAITFKRVQP